MWISAKNLKSGNRNNYAGYFNILNEQELYPVWGVAEDEALKLVSNKAIYMFSKCPLLFKDTVNIVKEIDLNSNAIKKTKPGLVLLDKYEQIFIKKQP